MKCNKCKREKELESFNFRNKVKNIKNGICKDCQKTYKNSYYRRNKESHYARNNVTKQTLKSYIKNNKNSGCVICRELSIPCLEYHHLVSENKEHLVSKMVDRGSLKKLKEEIDKCVILCSNCHRKIHHDLDKLILEILN